MANEQSPEKLTFAQLYEIPLKVTFSDSEDGIKVRYHACGSHAIDAAGVIDIEEARRVRDYLNTLPGIDSKD